MNIIRTIDPSDQYIKFIKKYLHEENSNELNVLWVEGEGGVGKTLLWSAIEEAFPNRLEHVFHKKRPSLSQSTRFCCVHLDSAKNLNIDTFNLYVEQWSHVGFIVNSYESAPQGLNCVQIKISQVDINVDLPLYTRIFKQILT